MYYKLRWNSTQFVIYYKLRNYYKLQRNKGNKFWYQVKGIATIKRDIIVEFESHTSSCLKSYGWS